MLSRVQMVLWAVGAGIGYGAALLFVLEALLKFRMGNIWWGWYEMLLAVVLGVISTVFAETASRLHRAQK